MTEPIKGTERHSDAIQATMAGVRLTVSGLEGH